MGTAGDRQGARPRPPSRQVGGDHGGESENQVEGQPDGQEPVEPIEQTRPGARVCGLRRQPVSARPLSAMRTSSVVVNSQLSATSNCGIRAMAETVVNQHVEAKMRLPVFAHIIKPHQGI